VKAKLIATKIAKVIEEAPNIKTFIFDFKGKAIPGQFVMVWLPGINEKPMSLSYIENFGITVKKIGEFTEKLHELEEGNLIGFRGPYGRGFKIEGEKLLFVAGGIGIAPIAPLVEEATKLSKEATIIMGARSENELIFVERIKKTGAKVILATEDGSIGVKGTAIDALMLRKESFDQCFACGPEKMLVEVLKYAKARKIPTQLSLERYFKCGIGICGSCALDDKGLLVCRDGPVFYDHELNGEFGKYKRDASGRRIKI